MKKYTPAATHKEALRQALDLVREYQAVTTKMIDLHATAHVLNLAAFAVDARRILVAVDFAVKMQPEIEGPLTQWVDARRNWAAFDDAVPYVLKGIAATTEAVGEDVTILTVQSAKLIDACAPLVAAP